MLAADKPEMKTSRPLGDVDRGTLFGMSHRTRSMIERVFWPVYLVGRGYQRINVDG